LRIAIVTEHYPSMRTSAANQMCDLAKEFLQQGHTPVVITAVANKNASYEEDFLDGITVLRLAGWKPYKNKNLVLRTLSEFLLPFIMILKLHKTNFNKERWDLILWYSPSIFFGPLIFKMKKSAQCKTYLILRDIFPEWALDLGLIRKGLTYSFFKLIANFQYSVADTIGVQTQSNLTYLKDWADEPNRKLQVLQNWQSPTINIGTSINIDKTLLSGRKIFAYIGNMGIAQGMDIFIDLAEILKGNSELGFLFVGRGSEVDRLKIRIKELALSNILFFDEVDPQEMPGLLEQCHVGLLALDPRHTTHNIPGKFLTYLLASLPVLARVNAGNDLVRLIKDEGVGEVYVGESVVELKILSEKILFNQKTYENMASRGNKLAKNMFSSKNAVHQIIDTIKQN
jgi:glycosyltransferase involved in cell wall biosynthesis